MTLDDYLTERNIRSAAFAETIGASRQAVSRWRRGERIPDPEMMRLIFAETGGAVTPNDFHALPDLGGAPVADDEAKCGDHDDALPVAP